MSTAPGPSHSFNINRVTVSGISSGAYMAGQLHVAHSAMIDGAGLLAGGPYWCANGTMKRALAACVKGGDIGLDAIAAQMEEYAAAGVIDDPENLRDDRVWLFHGSADTVVGPSVTAAAARFYLERLADEQVRVVGDIDVVHGMPTLESGLPCDQFGTPFIHACGFDAAGRLLEHLHGPLQQRADHIGVLQKIEQPKTAGAQLWDHAWLYAPQACMEGAECALHVAFHGCNQSGEFVGDGFASQAGYNEWAESNRLVVLYPQVKSSKLAPLNPLGCWDWWGYTGQQYATKEGPQIAAVMSMLHALINGPG